MVGSKGSGPGQFGRCHHGRSFGNPRVQWQRQKTSKETEGNLFSEQVQIQRRTLYIFFNMLILEQILCMTTRRNNCLRKGLPNFKMGKIHLRPLPQQAVLRATGQTQLKKVSRKNLANLRKFCNFPKLADRK